MYQGLDEEFAPRYRDLCDKVQETLYGFQHPSQYDDDWMLKPVRKLNPELVGESWDTIQRIMVSLARKTTTQHMIVSKLSAFARQNKTRRALWEYDTMSRSLYRLDSIDALPLLQQFSERSIEASVTINPVAPLPMRILGDCASRPNMHSSSGGNAPA